MATHWWLAQCRKCTPELPVPFEDQNERDEWAGGHADATGHKVSLFEELGP